MILTRCPNCRTVFRVTPEQLRVRHGQVRCGSCYATFNALSELSEELPLPGPAEGEREAQPAAVPYTTAIDEAPTVSEVLTAPGGSEPGAPTWSNEEIEYFDIGSAAPAEPDVSLAEAVPAAEPLVIEPPAAMAGDVATGAGSGVEPSETEPPAEPDAGVPAIDIAPLAETATDAGGEAAVGEATVPVAPEPPIELPQEAGSPTPSDALPPATANPAAEPTRDLEGPAETPAFTDARPEPSADAGTPAVEPAIAAGPPPPGFGFEEGRPSQWPWWAGAALALLALVFQAVIHFRTELAVRHPDARPALEALCAPFACDIPLPAKIGLLQIEHSDLVPDDGNAGRLLLTAALRNLAEHPQAWPHLELTLTDALDRPLTRRALAPPDYLGSAELVAAGFPARSEQVVSLEVRAAQVPAVGYRLYLFYP